MTEPQPITQYSTAATSSSSVPIARLTFTDVDQNDWAGFLNRCQQLRNCGQRRVLVDLSLLKVMTINEG